MRGCEELGAGLSVGSVRLQVTEACLSEAVTAEHSSTWLPVNERLLFLSSGDMDRCKENCVSRPVKVKRITCNHN